MHSVLYLRIASSTASRFPPAARCNINELTGQDLPGCEISYVTAIRMLEAILEIDEEPSKKVETSSKGEKSGDEGAIAGLEAEDRETVVTCKSFQEFTLTQECGANFFLQW